MMGLWIALVWLIWVNVSPALAELYRWTDATGKVHITDNLATIPPAYRERARASGSGTPASDETPASDSELDVPPPEPPPLPPLPARSRPASPPPVSLVTPEQIAELEQKIAAARQERQTYLEQLGSARAVRATPEFVRQRRQIAELGRALSTVEQQLDVFYVELGQAQKQFQDQQAPPTERPDVIFDKEGHDATYWQHRITVVREWLRQAQTQRREILSQLTTATGGEQRTAERRGRDILQQAQALQQIEQEIDAGETAIQALRQEALRAGTPEEWLQ